MRHGRGSHDVLDEGLSLHALKGQGVQNGLMGSKVLHSAGVRHGRSSLIPID